MTLDTGALGGPLAFSGLTLTWTDAGAARSRTLTTGS